MSWWRRTEVCDTCHHVFVAGTGQRVTNGGTYCQEHRKPYDRIFRWVTMPSAARFYREVEVNERGYAPLSAVDLEELKVYHQGLAAMARFDADIIANHAPQPSKKSTKKGAKK